MKSKDEQLTCDVCEGQLPNYPADRLEFMEKNWGGLVCEDMKCKISKRNENIKQDCKSLAWIWENIKNTIPTLFHQLDFSLSTKTKFYMNAKGAFISGPAGTGKTFGAWAALCYHLKDSPPKFTEETVNTDNARLIRDSFQFVSVTELLLKIRSSFDNKIVTELEVIKKYIEAPLLILDDLGAENSTDFSYQTLYSIINERINWCRGTIVTSNFRLSEIDTSDPRLASRLGSFNFISLVGDDKRLI